MIYIYEENEKKFKEYVQECRNRINNKHFSLKEQQFFIPIKLDMVKKGLITNDVSLEDAIKIYKNNMIDVKLEHTDRVVNNIVLLSNDLKMSKECIILLKICALLHDIARFEQAVYSTSFNDKHCKKFNGLTHAEYGYNMLYKKGKINDFYIPDKYKYMVMCTVRYHQIPNLKGFLALKTTHPNKLKIDNLTGNEKLNNHEKTIIAFFTQMVRDADMLDILYEHITDEFPLVSSFIAYKVNENSLAEICAYWGLEKEEIKKCNKLSNDNITNKKNILIPTENISIDKLKVPADIQRSFFRNELLSLKKLQNRRDWTFIIGMWWRLNHFFNSFNFIATLKLVKKTNLLDKIYYKYPDKYKILVYDAFLFTKERLVNDKIKKVDKLYI